MAKKKGESPEDIEDAVIVSDDADKPSKDDLIAQGLLPPKVAKKKPVVKSPEIAAAVQAETAKMTAPERAQPKHATTVAKDEHFQKASQRASMALELLKAMVQGSNKKELNNNSVDDLVSYAFQLADAVHAETDRGYKEDLMRAAAGQLNQS